ncbi:MAG: cache domain-containing protein [Desulfobacterales bacterium]|nr:cache domain-containing protein [Desulfobacterales bacterium]
MKNLKSFILLLVSIFFISIQIQAAEEQATKEECVEKCKKAAQLVKEIGQEAALAKIQDKTSEFTWKDSYVYVITLDTGTCIAHPEKPQLVGKVFSGLKDVKGTMFIAQMMNVALEKGEGWVPYMWTKPGEKKLIPKICYIYRVPGENIGMAAGIYEEQ